jgi:hypothetical protein
VLVVATAASGAEAADVGAGVGVSAFDASTANGKTKSTAHAKAFIEPTPRT